MMDCLSIIGLLVIIYFLVYIIFSFLFDCNILLAFKEKFGKPVSSLKGKTVWIVGASSGIGEHLAYVLARAGCKLILSARRVAELERIKQTCLKENKSLTNDDIEVYPIDITILDSLETAFHHVIEKFGRLDILVNNAGRSQRAKWENIEIEVDKEMFDLNVFPFVFLSRLAVKYFLKVGGGQIVITSSLAGLMPVPTSATYCATKHALHGYFHPLYLELPDKNIYVSIICPGPIQTNFLPECFTEKSGEKYGVTTDIAKSKVSAERCATLMAVAIANKLDEVWIVKPSMLRLVYMYHFSSTFTIWYIFLYEIK